MSKSEADLRRHGDGRLARLVELAPVGYAILDPDGRIEWINGHALEMLDRKRDAVLGRSLADFCSDDGKALQSLLVRSTEGDVPATLELQLERSAGPALAVNLRAVREGGSTLVAIEPHEQAMAQERQREFVHRLLRAQDDERRRLAQELHDEAGQTLTAIEVGLRGLGNAATFEQVHEQARRLGELVKRTSAELRRLARGLYPAVLDDLGLAPALARLAAEQRELARVPIELHLWNLEEIPAEAALTVYRVAQEALSNAIRHAEPGRIALTARLADDAIELEIADDGRGFVPGARARAGLGLRGMRERIEQAGGSFVVETIPGDGTKISASIPLR